MRPAVRIAAIVFAVCQDALAFRQMDAAMYAAHHILPAGRILRPLWSFPPGGAMAVGIEQYVDYCDNCGKK